VEDIRLARMIKAEGLKIAVLLGKNDVFCRMYRSFDEAVIGFSRNIHEYFGGQRAVMLVFWFIVCFGPFIVFFAAGWTLFSLFVLLVLLNRVFITAANRQSIFLSVLLHPVQMISFTVVVFYNIFRRIKKETTWKGRKIRV
jgi:chlorobactene glucosyltransferase